MLADCHNLRKAIQYANAAISIDPSVQHNHIVKGLIYCHERHFTNAIDVFLDAKLHMPPQTSVFDALCLHCLIDRATRNYEDNRIEEFLNDVKNLSTNIEILMPEQHKTRANSLILNAAVIRGINLLYETRAEIPDNILFDTAGVRSIKARVRPILATRVPEVVDTFMAAWEAHSK